jgi:hypothetical protein
LIFFAVSTLFLLSGCVDLVQEVTVDQKGAGTLHFAYGVDTPIYSQFEQTIPNEYKLENLFANLTLDENVNEVIREDYEENGKTWQAITLEIADMAALFAEEKRLGPILISIDEDQGTYFYQQTIDLGLMTVNIPGIKLLDLSGAGYEVTVITPQIIDTNGSHRAAGTSDWKVSIKDFVEADEAIFMVSEYRLEPYEGRFIPWELFFPYILFGFLGLGIATILIIVLVNTRRKVEDNPRINFDHLK